MSSRVAPFRCASGRVQSASAGSRLLALLSVLLASHAFAQTQSAPGTSKTPASDERASGTSSVSAPVPPESVEVDQARTAFAEGIEDAKEGRWLDALAALARSNELHPHAVTTYNIGYCERSLGRYTRARKMLAKALAQHQTSGGHELSSDLVAAAAGYLTEAERQIAKVSVNVAPATATVKVDGRPLELVARDRPRPVVSAGTREVGQAEVAPAANFDLLIDPGTHEFVVSASDHRVAITTHTFLAGSSVAIQLAVTEEHRQVAPSANHLDAPRSYKKPDRTPAWVALSVGGLGALVGTVSGVLAFAQKGDVAAACPDNPSCGEKRRSGNQAADIATGGFIVAGVGAAVGTVLLLTASRGQAVGAGVSGKGERFVRPFVGMARIGVEGRF